MPPKDWNSTVHSLWTVCCSYCSAVIDYKHIQLYFFSCSLFRMFLHVTSKILKFLMFFADILHPGVFIHFQENLADRWSLFGCVLFRGTCKIVSVPWFGGQPKVAIWWGGSHPYFVWSWCSNSACSVVILLNVNISYCCLGKLK